MKIIIGQEAICPDGLGRVAHVEYCGPNISWIQVDTYIKNYERHWSKENVELIDPRPIKLSQGPTDERMKGGGFIFTDKGM